MSELRRAVIAAAVATALMAVCAAPVLMAPRQQLFGDELVGRHHDPFTAMPRFAHPVLDGFTQPITDGAGTALSRLVGPVAAFNLLILFSFPLSAATAFALARYFGSGSQARCWRRSPTPFRRFTSLRRPITCTSRRPSGYRSTSWRCCAGSTDLASVLSLR